MKLITKRNLSALSRLKLSVLLIGLFLLIVFVSAVAAVTIKISAEYAGGPVYEWFSGHGWDRVMRRCLLITTIITLIVIARKTTTITAKDFGLITRQTDRPLLKWWQLFLMGIPVGIASFSVLAGLNIGFHIHGLKPDTLNLLLSGKLLQYLAAGLVIAFLEETVCRGMILNLMKKYFNIWIAAVLISALFALSHFLGPSSEAFDNKSFINSTISAFLSTLNILPIISRNMLRVINLTLLGIALSSFVIYTKTVWMGIGAHAAWVWVIKTQSLLTQYVPGNKVTELWLGTRDDFTDSIAAGIMLFGITAYVARKTYKHKDITRIRCEGIKWNVLAGEVNDVTASLQKHLNANNQNNIKVIKDYDGCSVQTDGEFVLKQYSRKKGWKGFRFAIRPSRCKRNFYLTQKLLKLNIPTPEVVAWAEIRKFGFLKRAFMLTYELKNVQSLTAWLKQDMPNQDLRSKVMASYGILTGMFHSNKYSNRDLKHQNVLCLSNDPAELFVIDLDGVRKKMILTNKRVKRDLRRIGLSLASLGWTSQKDIESFFSAYKSIVPKRLSTNRFHPE
jgi:membrane protease YdiL (CAAX protease family)/tRNA A-37 threonylcarbamoyl transferase component Bud32